MSYSRRDSQCRHVFHYDKQRDVEYAHQVISILVNLGVHGPVHFGTAVLRRFHLTPLPGGGECGGFRTLAVADGAEAEANRSYGSD